MPLVFIEVKKPNNQDGVLAAREQIDGRFQNPKFNHFVNLTQVMILSILFASDNLKRLSRGFIPFAKDKPL